MKARGIESHKGEVMVREWKRNEREDGCQCERPRERERG